MSNNILITGASGNIGSRVTYFLKANSIKYLVSTRKKNQKSEMSRWLDFYDPKSFETATKNIDTVFLLRPPAISDSKKYIRPFLEKAKENGVKNIIFLSVIGADKMTFLPHAKIELDIDKVGFERVFLRPSFFMENFSKQHRQEILIEDRISIPAGNAKINFIQAKDIGEVAAKLLQNPKKGKIAYDLTGEKTYTMQEIADIFSKYLNRKITYKSPNWISFYNYRRKLGDSKIQTLVMIMLYTLSRFGMSAKKTEKVEHILGKKPRSLEEYIQENLNLFF